MAARTEMLLLKGHGKNIFSFCLFPYPFLIKILWSPPPQKIQNILSAQMQGRITAFACIQEIKGKALYFRCERINHMIITGMVSVK